MIQDHEIEQKLEQNHRKPEKVAEELDVSIRRVINVMKKMELHDASAVQDLEDRFEVESHRDEEFQQRVEEHGEKLRELRDEIGEMVVGQEDVVDSVIVSMMCDGHALLEGVPGLGKSLLVETLSRLVSDTDFNRIQFVPDMLPSDILGQRVYNQKKGDFYVNKGPVFANFILADEINRAPPKTQAAMMEVMQEEKVSIEDENYELKSPYLVLATQNPLEQKGTYPLPEAIIDRFFMKLKLDYPGQDEEQQILSNNTISEPDRLKSVDEILSKEEILQVQQDVRDIYVSEDVEAYIVRLVNALRDETSLKADMLKYVDYGPSPRASIWLSMGASAKALMDGRTYVLPSDVKKVALPVLRHRIDLNYEGKIKDISTDEVVENVLHHVEPV